jgi:hypothetical protein
VNRGTALASALTLAAAAWACTGAEAPAPSAPPPSAEACTRLSERVDPWVPKPRVLVMTDIANKPDDQMSMVRLLVYSNQLDIEGLVATTSTCGGTTAKRVRRGRRAATRIRAATTRRTR